MFYSKKTEQPKIDTKPKVEPYEIHVMPVKFHKYLTKKGGWGKFVIILLVIFVVLAGIAFGAFYYLNQMQQQPKGPQQPVVTPPSNLNETQNINQPVANANTNVNANVNANANANANVNINENTNANTNANENTNANVNAPATPAAINYSSSLDSDNDGLTDVEEDLYSTEKRKPDTDEDGYIDGQELAKLFNPKAAGSSLLEISGLVNKYTNPIFNYEILHPSAWLARPTDQSLQEVIFQSATGEYIEVLIEDNPQKLDLVQWYLSQSPLADLNQLKKETTKQGYESLLSPDRLNAYLLDKNQPEKVYIISYNIGNKNRVNFLTTFEMMRNSFNLLPAKAATIPETPAVIPTP
jgi:hypothetical protein